MTKLKSKWIKDLNIKPVTLNLSEQVGSSFEFMCIGDHFLNITPVAQTLRVTTINKRDLLKLKSFYKAKDTVNKTNDSLQNWKKSSPTPH